VLIREERVMKCQQTLGERCHPGTEMLTVVQHQQGAAIGYSGEHRVVDTTALMPGRHRAGRDHDDNPTSRKDIPGA
jgi:hypothetical protein